MSDKHEQAADEIMKPYILEYDGLVKYLQKTFPEPVKIEGVRELLETLQNTTLQMNRLDYSEGEMIKAGAELFERRCALITDFIQKREAGK
jgi:hypothetical protein